MPTKNTFALTTAIPYVNAKPHIGHVLEWFQADAVARYQRLLGKEVSFAAGADENSLKNVQAAEKAGMSTQAWLDQYSQIFENAYRDLNISLTSFRRGSDKQKHWPGVQKLWELCVAAGDIYKKTYTGLYCVGCEAFYAPDELIDGKCPEHLVPPEEIAEENYFFRLSKYQKQIQQLIESDELLIVSETFKNEMLGFVRKGLEDFSVSRTASRARGVGVPVPNDPTQMMYVWFDALSIYLTSIGWGYDEAEFQKFWPASVHFIGKGINRFHSVYWIGMLLSAGLATPKAVAVHGYLTANGQKMSKSLGNVVDPFAFVAQYGLEPTRYYLLKEIPTHSDGDFSVTHFREVYTADLANGLGNLCSRVAKLCEKANVGGAAESNLLAHASPPRLRSDVRSQSSLPPAPFDPEFVELMSTYSIDKALQWVMNNVAATDEYLSHQQPWKQTGEAQRETLETAVGRIVMIAKHLQPFLPETAAKILQHFTAEKITALQPLFARLPE